MKIYDLTLPFSVHTPVFPGTPGMSYTLSHTCETDHYNLGIAAINSHAGTHTDAPRHFLADGCCLDEVPAGRYVGNTVIADCTGKRAFDEINPDDLAPWEEKIRLHKKVIVHTNWSAHAGTPEFFTDYPVITLACAKWLTSLGVEMLGVEAPSLNPAAYIEVHQELLSHDVAVVEALTGLGALPSDVVFFSGAPIPFAGADGFPIRALAIEF